MSAIPPDVERWTYDSPHDGAPDWALAREGRAGNTSWAVVLHGHGATGDQLFTRTDLRPRERQIARLGLGLLCPNLRGNAWMSPAAVEDLHYLLGLVRARKGAETFVFCSGSMGGTGNLIYAVRHPEDVAGVVALCPATDIGSYYRWAATQRAPVVQEIAAAICTAYGGTPDERPAVYAAHSAVANAERLRMPLRIVHGDADTVIPVDQSRCLMQSLQRHGIEPGYQEIPGGHHDSPLREFRTALLAVLEERTAGT